MTAPFDTVNTVLTAVNTRLNGEVTTLLPLGGQILDNTQAMSQQFVNSAWRTLQERLATAGLVLLQNEAILPACTALPVNDPAAQINISWTGYWNGQALLPAPVLPRDLIEPLEVEERLLNPASPGKFYRMDNIVGAMPAVQKQSWNAMWQWRQNAIYMPGAIIAFDLRVRYVAYFDDFVDTGDVSTANGWTPWFNQSIPIQRSFTAMVAYICAEVERARGNADAVLMYVTEGNSAADLITGKDFMMDKSPKKAAAYSPTDQYVP